MKKSEARNIVAAILACLTVGGFAGSLDSPGGASSPSSAMFTLSDVYNKLNDRAYTPQLRTGAFAEPTSGPASTMRTLNEIMGLVTNRAPVAKTGVTTSLVAGDDGAQRFGVSWPVPRFTIGTGLATNCVTDNLTGLMWARDMSNATQTASGIMKWDVAVSKCNSLVYGGYDDWRLPSSAELASLLNDRDAYPAICNTQGSAVCTEADPFRNVMTETRNFWTSTVYSSDNGYVWYYDLGTSKKNNAKLIAGNSYYVLPVRGGGN